ncbi:MAG: transcription antitermination factor NusB [Clostridia bacterium]|nr:transcription antitermination factor NusB [Clostridia bacterium]
MSGRISRREARQQAFELIFEMSFTDMSVESIIQLAGAARDFEASAYARHTAEEVYDRREELDGYIARFSRGRNFRRLSRVVLAALRLAIYEILYVKELDARISINEAIELTKKFSGQDEASFVHGVLGGFMKAYESGEIVPVEKQAAKDGDSAE